MFTMVHLPCQSIFKACPSSNFVTVRCNRTNFCTCGTLLRRHQTQNTLEEHVLLVISCLPTDQQSEISCFSSTLHLRHAPRGEPPTLLHKQRATTTSCRRKQLLWNPFAHALGSSHLQQGRQGNP